MLDAAVHWIFRVQRWLDFKASYSRRLIECLKLKHSEQSGNAMMAGMTPVNVRINLPCQEFYILSETQADHLATESIISAVTPAS
jgi:hypothetical protein